MQSDLWNSEIEEDERAARFRVWSIQGMGNSGFEELLFATDGHIRKIWNSREFQNIDISEVLKERLRPVVGSDYVEHWHAHGERMGANLTLLHRGDQDYPTSLYDLSSPPTFLYVCGDIAAIQAGPKVAIVGSRAASPQMCAFTEALAAELSQNKIAIVSGGALGVDGCAHRGSLLAEGTTIAVLPGAVDRPAPGRHRDLFAEISKNGAVISEYPLGMTARPFHFARRNRLIAAISDAVVVIRAELDSGTMITAKAADEIGRMVCAVPGALDDPYSAGCLELLVRGAGAVRHAEDVVCQVYDQTSGIKNHRLRMVSGGRRSQGTSKRLEEVPEQVKLPLDLSGLALDRQQVLCALDELGRASNHREILVDEIARHLGWNVAQISSILTELELYERVSKAIGTNAYRLV